MEKVTLCCPCMFGIESVLAGEIKRLGGEDIITTDGKVTVTGDIGLVARLNTFLRTAERVQILLGSFPCHSFNDLFEGAVQLPFERFVGRDDAFPVKGWSLGSTLHSIPDCQSIVKKAAVKRLEGIYKQSWFEETGPVRQIQFSIHKNQASIFLDTSGEGLHKRGYRQVANAAPIKETLAAGILDLLRIYPDTQIYDPFCGSGTFLIEAGLKALNIAPGMKRRFAAEKWDALPSSIWQAARQEAVDAVRSGVTFHGTGTDIDAESLRIAVGNTKLASLSPYISYAAADISAFSVANLPEGKALVVCNPPYGERLADLQESERLIREMGTVFVPRAGVAYAIISPHEHFEELFGRQAMKRRKLYNGMIKCQLYIFA